MRYFDTSAIQHHADEEVDLFPALIESMAGSDAVCIRELTDGLCADHRKLEAGWRRLRETLAKIGQGQAVTLPDVAVDRTDEHMSVLQSSMRRPDDAVYLKKTKQPYLPNS